MTRNKMIMTVKNQNLLFLIIVLQAAEQKQINLLNTDLRGHV